MINEKMDELTTHLKSTGFIFPGSEIYGGLANSWDYGPLGVNLKNNIKKIWWDFFVKKNPLNIGLDSSIIVNTKVWKTSGHLDLFNDLLVECKKCFSRYRVDKLIEEFDPLFVMVDKTIPELEIYLKKSTISCVKCGERNWSEIRKFSLMFKTNQGVLENEASAVYLRPESAQGIFINYKNVQRTQRKKLPFGIGQIGKAFRNEITPGNFIFRTREFEQMELEFFYNPLEKEQWFDYWLNEVVNFLEREMNLSKKNYRIKDIEKEELAHYSQKTCDIEYHFPFGWGELWGVAHRGSFDLNLHQSVSGEDLTYLIPETNKKILPEVIEPSVGVERLMLAVLAQAFVCEKISENSTRIVLKLPHKLAPYQLAVMPLQKQQNEQSHKLFLELLSSFDVVYDNTGNIGKRYRRQDAIGTPFVITYDFDSDKDQTVTVRNRDNMKQTRVKISELTSYFTTKF